MPAVLNRYSAFNYSDPFDDVLPISNSDIDVNDRAQLWGVYLLGENFVDEANEVIDILPGSGTLIDHETGDDSQYDTSLGGTGTIVSPGLNGTNYKLRAPISDSSASAIKNITAPTGKIFTITWYMELTSVVTSNSGGFGVQLTGSITTNVIMDLWVTGTSLRIFVRDDLLNSYTIGNYTFGTGVKKYQYRITNSSGGATADGSVELLVNDVVELTKTGIDIDDIYSAITHIEVGNSTLSGTSGTIDIDEILILPNNEAIYILGLIRTLAETVNISELILQVTGYVRVLAETINLFLVGESNLLIDHEDQTYSEYTSEPECGSITAPGLNLTSFTSQIKATSIIPGIFIFAAPTGTRFEISFYLDLSCFTTEQGTTDVLGVRITDGGGNEVLRTEILSTDGLPTGLRAVLTDDNAAETSISATTTREDTHQYQIILYKASDVSANNGIFEFYTDGILQGSSVIQDLFTNWSNLTDLEIGIMDLPGMDGHILIDQIAINTESNTAIYILRSTVAKIISETVNIVESIVSFPLFIFKIIDEALNISETVLNVFTLLLKIIADTLNISETNLNIKGLIKILAETLNITEIILRITGLVKILAETINISEAKIRLIGIFSVIGETINISEVIIAPYTYLKILIETINISETQLKILALVRVIVDGLALSIRETKLKVVGWVRIDSDTVNISELQLGPFSALFRIIDETLNISEAINRLSGLVKIDSDTINITENILKIRGMIRNSVETISITGTILTIFSLVRVLSETLYITEGIIRIRALTRILTSTLNISEIKIRVIGRIHLLAETLNISESNLISQGFNRVITETINIAEAILYRVSIKKLISETLNISEGVLSLRSLIRVLNDNLLVFEGIRKVSGLVKVLTDGILSIIENLLRPKAIIQVEGETINISETVSGSAILYLISKITKKTGVSIGDTLRRIRLRDREVL